MEDRFKFRAWDPQKQKMIYLDSGARFCDLWTCDRIPMQCTGLKDKNGKLIYEGDKVSFTVFDCFDSDIQYKGCAVWSGSRFMIWNKPDNEFYGADGGFDLDWVLQQDCDFEIVGNIYEIQG